MTALYIVLGLVALLLVLGWMPLEADAVFDGGLQVQIKVGFLRFRVYPPRKKEKTAKKAKTAESQKGSKAKKKEKQPFRFPNRRQAAYTLDTLVPALWRALVRFGRRIRIPVLRLHVVFGGEDPAETAVLYGRVQAAAAAGVPLLEALVRIGETDVKFLTDYTAERTVVSGRIRVHIRLWVLVALGCSMLKSVAVWLSGYRAREEKKGKMQRNAAGAASAA